jgi:putative membrane protein
MADMRRPPSLHGPLCWRLAGLFVGSVGGGLVGLALPRIVLAHGAAAPEPSFPAVLLAWSFDPTIAIPLLGVALVYLRLVRGVDRAHPANPVPRGVVACFLGGLLAIELALQSPIEAYDGTLFSIHMVQHLLLTLVAAPLLALGAPITLILRAVSAGTRRGVVLPILHSRLLRAISHPIVAWLVFAFVMWWSHFSPLFDLSLEEPRVHQLEHGLFLLTALLFWWPAVNRDPNPWRMGEPARILYTFLQMPQNTFLGLAIYSASAPLYSHYVTLVRSWGPTPLQDQQLAGAIMWVAGDLVFLASLLLIIAGWMRREERDQAADDARVDRQRASQLEREARLAEWVADERGGG